MITYAGLERLLSIAHDALAARRPTIWVLSAVLSEVRRLKLTEQYSGADMQRALGMNDRGLWQHTCGTILSWPGDGPPEYCGLCNTGGEWAKLYVNRAERTERAA